MGFYLFFPFLYSLYFLFSFLFFTFFFLSFSPLLPSPILMITRKKGNSLYYYLTFFCFLGFLNFLFIFLNNHNDNNNNVRINNNDPNNLSEYDSIEEIGNDFPFIFFHIEKVIKKKKKKKK